MVKANLWISSSGRGQEPHPRSLPGREGGLCFALYIRPREVAVAGAPPLVPPREGGITMLRCMRGK